MISRDNIRQKLSEHKKLVLLLGVSLLCIPLLIALFSPSPNRPLKPTINPSITRVPTVTNGTIAGQKISALQKTEIGKAFNENQARSSNDFINAKSLGGNKVNYSFHSPISVRPNEIRTNNGIAVFERSLTPEKSNEAGYAKISEYKKKYGEPERVIKGSRFYDWIAETYIYAHKGFAFIGNP